MNSRYLQGPMLLLAVTIALPGCGTSRRRQECEKLEDRVVEISLDMAQELQKLAPPEKQLDRATMEARMRDKIDKGAFMEECMKLDPDEVRCLTGAKTREDWDRCGFDDVALP